MNTVISYSSLSNDLKQAFRNWLNIKPRDLVSFPFKGKHMKGYIFDHETRKYLVVTELVLEKRASLDDEISSINEDI